MAVQVELARAAAPRSLGAKGVFAAALGNGLEFFDFTVYVTYLGMIGQAFFPSENAFASDLASAATFGAGFIARPLGGALIGAYGDSAGRRPAMTLSIGLMAIGSRHNPRLRGDRRMGADSIDSRPFASGLRGRRRSRPSDNVPA